MMTREMKNSCKRLLQKAVLQQPFFVAQEIPSDFPVQQKTLREDAGTSGLRDSVEAILLVRRGIADEILY